jgi:hypothetical protein
MKFGLLAASFVACLVGGVMHSVVAADQVRKVSISETASGMKVKTIIEQTWNPSAQAVVDKAYNRTWEFHEMTGGSSTVVRLYRGSFLMGTFGASGAYHEIVFQLPGEVQAGQTYQLKPIPFYRLAKKNGKYLRLAGMKDGELTALRFVNPAGGSMKRAKEASVKILSMTETEVVIHFRLKADLDPHLDFDMDERLTLDVVPPGKG